MSHTQSRNCAIWLHHLTRHYFIRVIQLIWLPRKRSPLITAVPPKGTNPKSLSPLEG